MDDVEFAFFTHQQVFHHGGHGGTEDCMLTGGSRLNALSGDVVDAAMKVHSVLGPGLLESAYEVCLAYELEKRGHMVSRQLALPIVYEEVQLDAGYKIDLLVDGAIVVEIKAVAKLHAIHKAQLLSYLRMAEAKVGLLINFHELHLRDGIRRVSN